MNEAEGKLEELSVIIIAGAEEHNIAACLESVAFAGEVVVVFSHESDATADIARKFTDIVLHNPFEGYAMQKRYALEHATREWALSIDADERVSMELAAEIRAVLSRNPRVNGFTMPRKNFYRDIWLRHGRWYPDRQFRLFRRTAVSIPEKLIHEKFNVDGTRGTLTSPLLHYTLPGIGLLLEKNVRYALYEAQEKIELRRATCFGLLVRPLRGFLERYLFAGGFLDGVPGLMVALVHAMKKAQLEMYLWELQHPTKRVRTTE